MRLKLVIAYRREVKLQLHDAIYRLRSNSNSLIQNLSLSNSHNNVASTQKNRGDKSHSVIVALIQLENKNLTEIASDLKPERLLS